MTASSASDEGSASVPHPGRISSRLLAGVFDLALIGAWAVVAAVVGLIVRAAGVEFEGPAGWDLFAFLTLIAPVAITFATLEASDRMATPGKARCALRVTDRHGDRLSLSRSLGRSAAKFAPWQIAHTGVFQMTGGSERVGLALAIAAQALVLCSLGLGVFDRGHRTLHDVIAGTRVIDAAAGASGMVQGSS